MHLFYYSQKVKQGNEYGEQGQTFLVIKGRAQFSFQIKGTWVENMLGNMLDKIKEDYGIMGAWAPPFPGRSLLTVESALVKLNDTKHGIAVKFPPLFNCFSVDLFRQIL